ncbi:MAG: hypothetical protein AAFY65_05565 [Pseudomonadota bacterium]
MARKSKKTEDTKPDREDVAETVEETTQQDADASEDNLDETLSDVLDEPQDPQDIKDLETMDGVADVDATGEAAQLEAPYATEDPADADSHGTADAVVEGDASKVDSETVTAAESTEAESVESEPAEAVASETERNDPPVMPVATAPQVIEKRGPGFVPLVLGGVIAAAIGYAIPTFLAPPPSVEGADTARLDALEAQLAGLSAPEAADLSGLEATQDTLATQISDLDARIAALEAAPVSAEGQASNASTANIGSDNGAAIAALETTVSGVTEDVSSLREEVAALSTQVEGLAQPSGLEDRVATLEGAVDALAAEENDAAALAAEAARNQLRLALDTGQPFAEPLSVLGGEAPDALTRMADTGVPTGSALAEAFPAIARSALTAARAVEPVDGNPVTAFLRRQTGARSLEPQEGTSADAVLSRAEAAVRDGNLSAALAEIEALPPEGQDVLSGWVDKAQTRIAALEAAQVYFSAE